MQLEPRLSGEPRPLRARPAPAGASVQKIGAFLRSRYSLLRYLEHFPSNRSLVYDAPMRKVVVTQDHARQQVSVYIIDEDPEAGTRIAFTGDGNWHPVAEGAEAPVAYSFSYPVADLILEGLLQIRDPERRVRTLEQRFERLITALERQAQRIAFTSIDLGPGRDSMPVAYLAPINDTRLLQHTVSILAARRCSQCHGSLDSCGHATAEDWQQAAAKAAEALADPIAHLPMGAGFPMPR